MDTVRTFDHLSQLSDEELLAVSQRMPSAFEVLLSRYQRLFYARAAAVVRNADEAEDIVQEAFIRIFRFADRFESQGGSFKAWAMTILMNVARTKYAVKKRDASRIAPLVPEHYESLGNAREEEYRETKDVIDRALQALPEDTARIMRRAFLDGLSYEELSSEEGISVAAIKTRVHRAKKVLAKVIGPL